MINFTDFCQELFQVLRAYEKEMVLYGDTGNRVYEPDEARRFYLTHDNILISIQEKGDDSSLKLYLSPSLNLVQVKGFVETLRIMATKANLLFHVKKFNKEIKPQDFATQASVNENQEMSMIITEGMYGTTKSSYLKLENARMIVRHGARVNENMIGSRGRNIQSIFVENAQGERFLFPVNVLSGARAMTQHVNQGGTFQDAVGEQIIRMANDFRNLARIAHPGTQKTVSQPEAFAPVRESAVQAMKATKSSFMRMAESRYYVKESEKVTAGASLMETSEDLSEKLESLVAILGEGYSEAELNTYARMTNLAETQDLAEDSSGWFVVNDEDYIKAGPFRSEEEANGYLSHGTKVMSGVLMGNQVISYERHDPEHYRMESALDESMQILSMDEVRDIYFGSGIEDAMGKVSSQEQYDQILNHIDQVYGLDADSLLGMSVDKLHYQQTLDADVPMFLEALTQIAQFVNKVTDGGAESLGEETIDEFKADDAYASAAGLEVDELFTFNPGDWVQVKGEKNGMTFKVVDVNGDIVTVVDAERNTGKMSASELEPAVNESMEPPITNDEATQQFEAWMEEFNPDTMFRAKKEVKEAPVENAEFVDAGPVKSPAIVAGMFIKALDGSDYGAKIVYEVLGYRTDHNGDDPEYSSLKEMAQKFGARNLGSLDAAVREAKGGGYGHGVFMCVKDLSDGSHGSWFYVSNGRFVSGSGADRLSFVKMTKGGTNESLGDVVDEARAPATEAIEEAGDLDLNDLKTTLNTYKAQLEKTSAFDRNYGKLRGMIKDLEKQIASSAPYGKSMATVDESRSSK